MGGQYEPHYDMKTTWDMVIQGQPPSEAGNRVATLLMYLTAPQAGGATIYTEAGARLSSVKVGDVTDTCH